MRNFLKARLALARAGEITDTALISVDLGTASWLLGEADALSNAAAHGVMLFRS